MEFHEQDNKGSRVMMAGRPRGWVFNETVYALSGMIRTCTGRRFGQSPRKEKREEQRIDKPFRTYYGAVLQFSGRKGHSLLY